MGDFLRDSTVKVLNLGLAIFRKKKSSL